MQPARQGQLIRFRRIILGSSLLVGVLLFTAVLATLIIRSTTAFSHFTRREFCALCGIERSYRETCLFDYPFLRSTTLFENGVSGILSTTRTNCGHNFHTAHERMSHYSIQRTPIHIRRESGFTSGSDIFSHPTYLAALARIHAENSESAQLIWNKTFRRFAESHTDALNQLLDNLSHNDPGSTQSFLITDRYFRPRRPNPERW